jgi:hypothetical protein
MLILRVVFLEFLVCLHFIGAAVLFRRFFPNESPWFGFIMPILVLLTGLNFIEHYIALSNLGWLLPLTLGGMIWTLVKPGYSWTGLVLPSILFVATFTFVLLLICLTPSIPSNTEGTGNMTRVLNYCIGGTLPPVDCFMPPYDYGGYYSFQQYGAAIMKRLFFLDLGTAYNLAFAFLLAWTSLVGAAVAHAISGKKWVAIATTMVLLAGSTGSVLVFYFANFNYFGHYPLDYILSTNLNDVWDDHTKNPFWSFTAHDKFHPGLKLLPPTYELYYSEFHADLGGCFVTLTSLLPAVEVFRLRRSNWPWIALVTLPILVIITSAWFFFIVAFFCTGSLIIALIAGRRPDNWRYACIAGGVGLVFLWPSVFDLLGNPSTQKYFFTTPDGRTPFWMFAVQWWPVYVPWCLLCFVWHRLDLMSRWLHAALPILFIWVEFSTFGDRGLTIEKMWGALYGAGLVTLLPMICIQKNLLFRSVSTFILLIMAFSLWVWVKSIYIDTINPAGYFRIQGDSFIQDDPQTRRIVQVLKRLHAATVLPGKSYWAYNDAPAAVGFSENRCYIAYFHQEDQAGHSGEAEYRNDLNNSFYDGKMASPLPFLRANDIAAVLIWPEDNISDELLQQFQTQIGSDYFYVDCKMGGANNAGVFMRQTAPVLAAPSDLSPLRP